MGTTVCSYHVRSNQPEDCRDALRRAKSPRAYLSAAANDWITIVDENASAFNLEAVENTASSVSATLETTVIVMAVYDEEVSAYVVLQSGGIVDRYGSVAGAFDWLPAQKFDGDAKRVAAAINMSISENELKKLLNARYRLESSRLRKLAQAFGILEHRAFTTFQDVRTPLDPRVEAMLLTEPDSELSLRMLDRGRFAEFK